MRSNTLITCIIVNWNGWQDTIDCLTSLRECKYPDLDIVVVDNGSTNESVGKIRSAHPDILLFANSENLGFAGGNNVGIRHALAHGADFVWLLNNDTKPDPNALTALVHKAISGDRIGAVGSICYYYDRPETVQIWAGGRVNLWTGYAACSTIPHNDDWFHWLNGASLLLSAVALKEIGLLDEGFFLYWEDSELCLRLRKNQWRLAAAADSHVLHKVSASSGGSSLSFDRHFTASDLRILRLYAPLPYLSMALFLAARLVRRAWWRKFAHCRSVWAGFAEYRRSSLIQKTL
jgi:GT2 family glycosyltransferase